MTREILLQGYAQQAWVAAMNRRELIRNLLGTAAASGAVMTATVTATAAAPNSFLLVFEAPGYISKETADRLKEYAETALKGSAFENVKIFVLGDGMKLTTIAPDGTILTRPVTTRRRKAAVKPGP